MSRRKRISKVEVDDQLVVRVRLRTEPDLRRLARALIAIAMQELEAERVASVQDQPTTPPAAPDQEAA